jgi:hypothetical protein
MEIRLDNRTPEKVVVGRDGSFSAAVKAPSEFGAYRLTITDDASGKVIDAATVAVRAGRGRSTRPGPR